MCSINHHSVQEIIYKHAQSTVIVPLIIFIVDCILYSLLFYTILIWNHFLIYIIASILLGLFTAFLFIVGHDACHQSFTPFRMLNKIIGVISFLPSLHNFLLWDLGHNRIHHAYTNLISHDYVYSPLSRQEYNNLSHWNKWKYKLYRSIIGHALYYGIEIWCKKMIVPRKNVLSKSEYQDKFWTYLQYSAPLLIYMLSTLLLIIYFINHSVLLFIPKLFFAFLFPFFVFNWIMGFAIFQHHTSPYSRWYASKSEWQYWNAQVMESVHIKFPGWINLLLHNVMEHTAHHCNTKIPLYNLRTAQADLEKSFANHVKIVNWNMQYYWNCMHQCKIYNFEQHKWEKFT